MGLVVDLSRLRVDPQSSRVGNSVFYKEMLRLPLEFRDRVFHYSLQIQISVSYYY